MPKIIDGKEISAQIKKEIKEHTEALKKEGISVCLAVIQVGSDPASCVYIRNKQKACEYAGIRSLVYELPAGASEQEVVGLIEDLNNRKDVDGILVQLPLPAQIDERRIISSIAPEKDVDGFHPLNMGALCEGNQRLAPCTPAGIIELLKRSNIELAGRECLVIGRSNIVGKPLAMLLLQENATVTVAHSKTADLKKVAKRADILIAAIGKPEFITEDYVKEGAVIVDVGIHRREGRKLCGDVKFDDVAPLCGAITPVPGGVGPMTIAMLLSNCVEAAVRKNR